jgi:hypothetical protein
MMERLFAHDFGGARDSERLSYMKSSSQVENVCRSGDVFLAANTFVHEDFRQVKYILTKLKRQSVDDSAFIIYHLPSNEIPPGLISTLEWPVFWVECVSISPLKDISIAEIVDCCLNPDLFKWIEHRDLLRVVVRKLMEDMTHSYKMKRFASRQSEYSEEYQQLLCLFAPDPNAGDDARILKAAETALNRFIDATVNVLVAVKGRTNMASLSRQLLRKLRHPTQFLHVNLKQEFYLALRGLLSPHVSQAIKILLNGNRSLTLKDADLPGQIRDVLQFVESSTQWLPPASQIVGRVWPGSPDAPFFADFLLPILNRFFSRASYAGPLRPARVYLAKLFEKNWLCHADIFGWARTESPMLAEDYAFDPSCPSCFEQLFARLLPYRAYGFHYRFNDTGATAQLSIDRRLERMGDHFTRASPFRVSAANFTEILLSDFHGVWEMDNWSGVAAPANWIFAFRPVWQFYHGKTDFASDDERSDGIGQSSMLDGTLAAVVLTDSGTFTWENLQSFVRVIPGDRMTPEFRDSLFEAWESARFAAAVRPRPPSAISQSTFKDWFGLDSAADSELRAAAATDFKDISDLAKTLRKGESFRALTARLPARDFPSSVCFVPRGEGGFFSVLDRIRTEIVLGEWPIVSPFTKWIFDADTPLLDRQTAAVIRAIDGGDLERELTVLSLLLNPWSDQTRALREFLTRLDQAASTSGSFGSLVKDAVTSEVGRLSTAVTPFVYVDADLRFKSTSTPPIERVLLATALLNSIPSKSDQTNIFRFLRSVGRVRWTRYLADLAAFGDSLQRLFSEQLNLLFLLFATLRCGDLPSISVRFFGAEPYRAIADIIHNRSELRKALQPRTLTPAQLADLRALKEALPPKTDFGDAVDNFVQLPVPESFFHGYALALLEAADAVEPFACGGRFPKCTGYGIWQTLSKMIDAVYEICGVDRPLVRLFDAIEKTFPDSPGRFYRKCARDQLDAFVSTAIELHNAMAIHVPDQKRLYLPAKLATLADLHWNMTFANAVCPFVALADGADPLQRLLCGLGPNRSFRGGLQAADAAPMPLLTVTLTRTNEEDFMGFATTDLAASLFDDAVRHEWLDERIPKITAWSSVPERFRNEKLSLPLFLLACVRLMNEAPIDPEDKARARFGILALFFAIFTGEDPAVAARFCPTAVQHLLPFGWDAHYFWHQQLTKWNTWADKRKEPSAAVAQEIGVFAQCSEALAAVARAARRDYLWTIRAKETDGGK